MISKIDVLKAAMKKAANDIEYIAYFLFRYLEIEKITEAKLIDDLNCSEEDYYKLGLCRTPEIDVNYVPQLKDISDYTNTSFLELNKIIKQVKVLSQLSNDDTSVNEQYLMAARDKNKKSE